MQKPLKIVSAWWASPLIGLVLSLMSQAFTWGYPLAESHVPSFRNQEGYGFFDQIGAPPVDDESSLLMGKRMGGGREMERWESLPPEERREMRRRMEQWKELSPQDQQLLKKRYRQWQELSPEERQRMRENLQEWDTLSPQEQERIRRRFQTP